MSEAIGLLCNAQAVSCPGEMVRKKSWECGALLWHVFERTSEGNVAEEACCFCDVHIDFCLARGWLMKLFKAKDISSSSQSRQRGERTLSAFCPAAAGAASEPTRPLCIECPRSTLYYLPLSASSQKVSLVAHNTLRNPLCSFRAGVVPVNAAMN